MHALIVGPRGVGKTTLISRVLKELNMPLFGFETKKEIHLEDPVKGSPVYIYEAGKEHIQTDENLVGHCLHHRMAPDISGFDRFAPKLAGPVPGDCIVAMDEVGFMEAKSEALRHSVSSLLDGKSPVIAAVKDKDIPFLDTVRAHPGCRCFYSTMENRDTLCEEVLACMKEEVVI